MSVRILLPLQTYPDGNSETLLHHAVVIAAHLQGELHALVMAAEAVVFGSGRLVMGGFGHSRMRDFVLGGTTLGILRNLRMPVLLSH